MVRVALCDDDAMVRTLLHDTLESAPDVEVVAVCGSAEEALAIQEEVDVWLMDQRMPGMTGIEACRRLTSRTPPPKVIILTAFTAEPVAVAYYAGACGYLYKDETPENLLAAIRAASAGYAVNSSRAMSSILTKPTMKATQAATDLNLDESQKHLAGWLLSGRSYAEIAAQLHLSESGLKKQVTKLMRQFGVRSRPQLMSRLHQLRIDSKNESS